MRVHGLTCFVVLGMATLGHAGAVVRMASTTPPNGLNGGYAPGTIVDVDVYLSQDPPGNEILIRHLQLDFAVSGPELLLIPPLTHVAANVRVWVFTEPGGNCVSGNEPTCGAAHFLDSQFTLPMGREKVVSMTFAGQPDLNRQRSLLAAGETLIARVKVEMPADPRPMCYNLDALNAAETNPDFGGADLRFGFGIDADPTPPTTWRVGQAPPDNFRSANTGPGGAVQLCVNVAAACDPGSTCNGHGACNAMDGCDCDPGYVGSGCSECAADYYGFPNCVFCDASTSCSGNGICNALGQCDCEDIYAGAACDQCAEDHYDYPTCAFCEDATSCNAHGVCDAFGNCACNVGFVGVACEQCAPDYHNYPYCRFCAPMTTCSGNGLCTASAQCDCDDGYGGAACDQCAPDHYAYPDCVFCDPYVTCSGNGACNAAGQCRCDDGYAATACDECAANHYSYPTCTFCDSIITCGGHGVCNASGACDCDPGFVGESCNDSCEPFCEPIPAASHWGLAVLGLLLLILGKLRLNIDPRKSPG